jgi:hypothetical protein
MNQHETITFAHLLTRGPFPIDLSPLQHDEVDIGDDQPVRCLKNGLWLSKEGDLPFALLIAPGNRFGRCSEMNVEVATLAGEPGTRLSQQVLRDLELKVGAGRAQGGPELRQAAVDAAIEEMMFTGGALNVSLLGGSIAASSRPS